METDRYLVDMLTISRESVFQFFFSALLLVDLRHLYRVFHRYCGIDTMNQIDT